MRRSSVSVLLAMFIAACAVSSGAPPTTSATPAPDLMATATPPRSPVADPFAALSRDNTAESLAAAGRVPATSEPSATPTLAPTPWPISTPNPATPTDARPAATPNPHGAAANAIDWLAADLYRELVRGHANLVFSPYSAEVSLAMARVGARGLTRSQMDAVLRASRVGDLDQALGALERELARRPGQYPYGGTSIPLELATANRLWAQNGFDFERQFLDTLSTRYGAGLGLVDYMRAADAARRTINEWVADRTRARIPELIPEDVLNVDTRFVLTNAIYLKAKWQRPFHEELTRPAPFHRLDGSDGQASMMRAGILTFLYRRGSDYQVVRLPYVGGLSMAVIVPDAGAFTAFETRFDGDVLGRIVDDVDYTAVDLSMPRFGFRTGAFLTGALARIGMPIAFTDLADFSGISTEAPLAIQTVIQEAFISVDEEGTEASAATAVIGGVTGGPQEWITLTIDRPFLFLIRDDATGATLFLGRVLDPS